MLTFKNYLAGQRSWQKTATVAQELAETVRDPENFILKFTESRYPHLYPRLVSSLLEAQMATPDEEAQQQPTDQPGDASEPGRAPSEFKRTLLKKHNSSGGGIADFFSNLFGGGGAARNFKKALTSLQRVNGIIGTVNFPKEIKDEEGSGLEDYDQYVSDLRAAIKTLQGLESKSDHLAIADAVRKNPQFVDQSINQYIGQEEEGQEEQQPPAVDQNAPTTGDGSGTAPATNAPATNGTAPVTNAPATATTSTETPEQKKAREEEEERQRQAMNTSREHRKRKGSIFSEALVLAGVPATRSKKR